MVNKFLVSVVFAIVTQSSVLLSSATFDGFPEEGRVIFDELQAEDLAARAKIFNGFGAFFDMLINGTGQESSYQDLSPLAEALTTAAEATDIIYHSALLVSRGDCDEIEVALNESRAQLHGVIKTYVSTVALVRGGNYDENRHEIEKNRNSSRAGLVSSYQTVFDFLHCCISDSSHEFESLLDEVQEKVNEYFDVFNNAVYEAIEAYSTLVSDCTEEEAAAALLTIRTEQLIVIVSAVDIIEHMYSLYETTYVVTYLNCDDIAHGVFDIRLARKRVSDKMVEAMKVVFVAITGRLLGYDSHHQTESNNSNSADATKALAVSLLEGADYHFSEIVLLSLPDSADNVRAAKIVMPRVLLVLINHYYQGMDLAETGSLPYHLRLLAIEAIGEIEDLVTTSVVETCFEVIGSDPSTVERALNGMTARLQEANHAVFAAIVILSATAHSTDGASQDDFNDVQTYLLTAINSVQKAAAMLFGALLHEYIVESGY